MQRKVYILENLDCANCAAKIERKLSKLPELSDVSVTFATKQLRFAAEDPEAVLPKIRETIQSMEPDVEVVERTRSRRKAEETHNHEHHHHKHGEECGCGHDHHDHDHDHEEHEHHHHHHADEVFTSWGMETIVPVTKDQLEDILKRLAETKEFGDVLRAKGMLPTENPGEWLYFDLVPEQYEIRDGKPDYTGKVCVIGASLKEEELNKVFGRG